MIAAVRRELRRVVDVLVEDEQIVKVLRDEVIKRDTQEGPEAEAAVRRVNKVEAKLAKAKTAPAATAIAATQDVPPVEPLGMTEVPVDVQAEAAPAQPSGTA